MSKPTVLLLHGAFHHPSIYDLLAEQLEDSGFQINRPYLPSCADPPNGGLDKDVAFVRDLLLELFDQGRAVLVVCHSYSGLVATQAIHDLPKAPKDGDGGGLVALVAMCAFIIKSGQSVTADYIRACDFEDFLPVVFDINTETDVSSIKDVEYMFGADVPDAAEKERYWKDVGKFPWDRCFGAKVQYEGWRELPFTYVRTSERDTLVPKAYQEIMHAYFEEVGGVREVYLDTGHYPFIAMPVKVVEIIKDTWDEAMAS